MDLERITELTDREAEIIRTALPALGMEGYELKEVKEGLVLSKDGSSWRNGEISRHISREISSYELEYFRDQHFTEYTDFIDLEILDGYYLEEIFLKDNFYLDLENEKVEWIYYNPDSSAGGHFVENVFDFDLLKEAWQGEGNYTEAFEYIEGRCRQYLADKDTIAYDDVIKKINDKKAFSTDCTLDTLRELCVAMDIKENYTYQQQRLQEHARSKAR